MKNTSAATMRIGLILALGMGGLLLGWLALDEGSGFVGLLFIAGIITGLITVVIGAMKGSER